MNQQTLVPYKAITKLFILSRPTQNRPALPPKHYPNTYLSSFVCRKLANSIIPAMIHAIIRYNICRDVFSTSIPPRFCRIINPMLLQVLATAMPVVIRADDTRLRTTFSVIIIYKVVASAFINTTTNITTGAEREKPNAINSTSDSKQAVHNNVLLENRSMKVFEYKMIGISAKVLKKRIVPISPDATPRSVSRRGR